MKCQNLFSVEIKKNILKCCLLKFLPSMPNVNPLLPSIPQKMNLANSVDPAGEIIECSV